MDVRDGPPDGSGLYPGIDQIQRQTNPLASGRTTRVRGIDGLGRTGERTSIPPHPHPGRRFGPDVLCQTGGIIPSGPGNQGPERSRPAPMRLRASDQSIGAPSGQSVARRRGPVWHAHSAGCPIMRQPGSPRTTPGGRACWPGRTQGISFPYGWSGALVSLDL
jgi:hypothetical protein